MDTSDENDFKKLIKDMSKGLDSNTISNTKVDKFYEICDRSRCLPDNSSSTVIDNFI